MRTDGVHTEHARTSTRDQRRTKADEIGTLTRTAYLPDRTTIPRNPTTYDETQNIEYVFVWDFVRTDVDITKGRIVHYYYTNGRECPS